MPHPLADRDSATVKDALTRRCKLCRAVPDDECTNQPITDKPLIDECGRIVHSVRTMP